MKLKLENKTVEVKKLPLKRLAELVELLKSVPDKIKDVEGVENLTEQNWADYLPQIITKSIPEFTKIVEFATDMKADEVENLGLHEVIDVILAVEEKNRLIDSYLKLKKKATQAGVLGGTQLSK